MQQCTLFGSSLMVKPATVNRLSTGSSPVFRTECIALMRIVRYAKRSNAADCKSVLLRVRWFESTPHNQLFTLQGMKRFRRIDDETRVHAED